MIFRKNEYMNIKSYYDSDWVSCQEDKKSTSGYCMFIEDNLVSWQSKKQPIIVRSMIETEWRAMTLGVAEMLWLKRLLEDLEMNHRAEIEL
jgi:hypothetical protein